MKKVRGNYCRIVSCLLLMGIWDILGKMEYSKYPIYTKYPHYIFKEKSVNMQGDNGVVTVFARDMQRI